jgi:S1-C subfamily serine protease
MTTKPSPKKAPKSRRSRPETETVGEQPAESPSLLKDRRFLGALLFLAAVAVFSAGFAVGHAVGEDDSTVGGDRQRARPGVVVAPPAEGNGYLGVAGTNARGLAGALILDVMPGSPADDAGFESGDLVVAAGDRDVPSMEALARIVRAAERGTSMEFTVLRGDLLLTLAAEIGARPPEPFPPHPLPGG